MSFTFAPATREQAKARIALEGPSGSGKTYTSLTLASALADRIALIDTERGSASKYAAGTSGRGFTFDTLQMSKFDPRDLVAALAAAGQAGYGAVIVDSLSHFWMGQGGMLELVDAIGKRSGSGGGFGGWKEARPFERAMIDALLAYPGHVIVTMRTKSEWVIEEDSRGKKQVRKVGTKAEQREGIEYEFDVVGDLDQENTLVITKSRCPELAGAVINRPGADMAATISAWLADGTSVPDAAELLRQAQDPDLTYEAALALHATAERHRLLGAAVAHPVTQQPAALGDVIVERGRQLRAAARPAASVQQQAEPPAPAPEPQETVQAPAPEAPAVGAWPTPPQQPAAEQKPGQAEPATPPQMRMMHAAFNQIGLADRAARLDATSLIVGRQIASANELTKDEAGTLLDALNKFADKDDALEAFGKYLDELSEHSGADAA